MTTIVNADIFDRNGLYEDRTFFMSHFKLDDILFITDQLRCKYGFDKSYSVTTLTSLDDKSFKFLSLPILTK